MALALRNATEDLLDSTPNALTVVHLREGEAVCILAAGWTDNTEKSEVLDGVLELTRALASDAVVVVSNTNITVKQPDDANASKRLALVSVGLSATHTHQGCVVYDQSADGTAMLDFATSGYVSTAAKLTNELLITHDLDRLRDGVAHPALVDRDAARAASDRLSDLGAVVQLAAQSADLDA
jgi:hypothetical protein